MAQSADEAYAAFEEKVKKTIYVHNLSPQVTKAVLENALNQFGNVKDVNFIPNYFTACGGHAALVQMESAKQAEEVIRDIAESPLMVSGMPRPVKAQKAEADMFEDRPKKHKKRIVCRWIDPSDKDFEVAKRKKVQTKKHAAEIQFLMGVDLAEEEKLHNQQSETLKMNYKKYELIDGTHTDGNMKRLAAHTGQKLMTTDFVVLIFMTNSRNIF
ncbi:ASI1-immunoprecipitated protein 1-like [Bidens hawaiensis]|uniref:ASI1-immunoprecipitated protein 1-like n=1 Tax=Bidens hawaiensis TaxID=980011 RepID=UPI0040497D15